MAARLSRKRLPRYSLEFKLKAVRLTRIPCMQVQTVAEALDLEDSTMNHWSRSERPLNDALELANSPVVPLPPLVAFAAHAQGSADMGVRE